jgi:hypothetical protein
VPSAVAASELEYYVYEKSPRELRAAVSEGPCVERLLSARVQGYAKGAMRPASDVVEDYHLLQARSSADTPIDRA